jgi:hypothetical protein
MGWIPARFVSQGMGCLHFIQKSLMTRSIHGVCLLVVRVLDLDEFLLVFQGDPRAAGGNRQKCGSTIHQKSRSRSWRYL